MHTKIKNLLKIFVDEREMSEKIEFNETWMIQ